MKEAVVNLNRMDVSRYYSEFLRVPSMSAGLYVHEPGQEIPQQPHAEDEVYYVLEGRGSLEIGGVDHAMEPGSFAFVPARVAHHFHSVEEKLRVLVFFAPAESPSSGA